MRNASQKYQLFRLEKKMAFWLVALVVRLEEGRTVDFANCTYPGRESARGAP